MLQSKNIVYRQGLGLALYNISHLLSFFLVYGFDENQDTALMASPAHQMHTRQAGRQGSNNQHSGHPMRQDPDCHIFGSFCLQSLNSPNFYMPTPLHRELFSSSHFSDSQPSTNHFFLKFHEIHRGVELRRPQWLCMPHVIQ